VLALTYAAPHDDHELIDAALAGDEQSFGVLIGRYQDRLFRLLARFTRDPGEVEDLAQEVFVKVFRKLHTFQRDSAFFTWLYRIGVNTANDRLETRRRRRLHLVEDTELLDRSEATDGDGDGAAQPLLDAELREVTREILGHLPEKFRTVLILREYEDLSYTEMAEVLGISIGTVESRLFRARQKFKDALCKRYPDLVPGRGGER
jgi:RNA polymerase sigma-70 factor (ECF subfamily)